VNKLAKHLHLLLFLLIAILLLPIYGSLAAGQSAQDNSDIASTKTAIANAYLAAKDAEAQGANVSPLMATLNEAGQLLTQAELAYSAKDYSAAANFAAQSRNKLNGFNDLAANIKATATSNNSSGFFKDILLVIGAIIVLAVGILAYVVLGRKERRSELVDSVSV
jgi:hypothetical protein